MNPLLPALPAVAPRSARNSALVCAPVFEEICVNANGDIVCSSCDVNGQRIYGNVFKDRIQDVYNGPMYQEMREWLLCSRPDTWCPAIKHQCSRRTTPATAGHETTNCRVKVLKLEPATFCNLECPACPVELQFKQDPFLKATRGHKQLPLGTMLDVVAQLPDLEWIFYFNFGEPFLNKETVPFLREVRRTRPSVRIATNTNGLVLTPSQIKAIAEESLMDRVIFSIDGANPISYRKYRVGGDLSKALNKMSTLVNACRAAGTWRRLTTDPPGGVQISWQYILFEWNDSDEELAKAQDLAKSIGVPIEWVITCGYGASKRFLTGTREAARLMNGAELFVHMAAPADLANRIRSKELGAFDFDVFKKIQLTCDLLALPYVNEPVRQTFSRPTLKSWALRIVRNKHRKSKYKARIRCSEQFLTVPRGATILLQVEVKNSTRTTWDATRPDLLRLGVQLRAFDSERVDELPGAILPSSVASLYGKDEIFLRATVPSEPGDYKLTIDVVQESICWFSDQGSSALEFDLKVE